MGPRFHGLVSRDAYLGNGHMLLVNERSGELGAPRRALATRSPRGLGPRVHGSVSRVAYLGNGLIKRELD